MLKTAISHQPCRHALPGLQLSCRACTSRDCEPGCTATQASSQS